MTRHALRSAAPALVLLTLRLGLSLACTSAHAKAPRPRPEVTNEVDPLPALFSLSDDPAAARALCPRSLPSTACAVVKVRLDALAASSMTFPDPFRASTPNSGKSVALKKTTEEGLKLVLGDPASPATATVTYKYQGQTIPFVVKSGKVFSSFNLNGRLTLKPCEARTRKTAFNCHVLLLKSKPH